MSSPGRPRAATHEALRADFIEALKCRRGIAPSTVESLANQLVHLVVLHGLLPEVE